MNCEEARRNLSDTNAKRHVRDCAKCIDVLVSETLEAGPVISPPVDFASRLQARLPLKTEIGPWPRHGSLAAILLLTIGAAAGAIVVTQIDGPTSRAAVIGLFAILFGIEIAALVFWIFRPGRL